MKIIINKDMSHIDLRLKMTDFYFFFCKESEDISYATHFKSSVL